MEPCQCGHTDFVGLPLLHQDQSHEEGYSYEREAYSRITHRTEEIQTIYEAWMKVKRMSPKRQRNRFTSRLTAEKSAAQREKEFYDAMTDEGKAWHDAAGRWPERLSYGSQEDFTSKKEYDARFHLDVSLRLKMCTSCGASTIYSNIDEHNRCIDALLPLAQQKLASVVVDEKAEEKAKQSSKDERREAEERVNELKKQLADAEQAHDSANKRVGDGKKDLRNRRRNIF